MDTGHRDDSFPGQQCKGSSYCSECCATSNIEIGCFWIFLCSFFRLSLTTGNGLLYLTQTLSSTNQSVLAAVSITFQNLLHVSFPPTFFYKVSLAMLPTTWRMRAVSNWSTRHSPTWSLPISSCTPGLTPGFSGLHCHVLGPGLTAP